MINIEESAFEANFTRMRAGFSPGPPRGYPQYVPGYVVIQGQCPDIVWENDSVPDFDRDEDDGEFRALHFVPSGSIHCISRPRNLAESQRRAVTAATRVSPPRVVTATARSALPGFLFQLRHPDTDLHTANTAYYTLADNLPTSNQLPHNVTTSTLLRSLLPKPFL